MNRTIKFRGVEFFGKKFVYGQTIRETEDGFDMWTGDDWVHCTNLAQLVGFDRDGREVYEGDTVVIPCCGTEIAARLINNLTVNCKLKEPSTWT